MHGSATHMPTQVHLHHTQRQQPLPVAVHKLTEVVSDGQGVKRDSGHEVQEDVVPVGGTVAAVSHGNLRITETSKYKWGK